MPLIALSLMTATLAYVAVSRAAVRKRALLPLGR